MPRFLLPALLTSSVVLFCCVHAAPVNAAPELKATARSLPGTAPARLSAGANSSNFSLGTDQSKFNLGTSANQGAARSSVGVKVSRDNPAIMTIVGHNEADIEKLLAKRYHRTVIPIVPYQAPEGPMQQVVRQQQINGQTINQQVVAQQTVAAQTPFFQTNWTSTNVLAVPIETVNRFFNISPTANKSDLSATAKPLKPFGQATYIKWDSWYHRIRAAADARWQSYNNQLNVEVTAHVTVSEGGRLSVSGVDVNLWKSANPWDSHFNDAARQAALETVNSLKGSSILKFPVNTRRSDVSFDLVFSTGNKHGVGMNAPINDVETVYGL